MNQVNFTKTAHIIFFVLVLPILSVVLVLSVSSILEPLKDMWYFPFMDGLSFIGAYAALFIFFDRVAWRLSLFQWLSIVTVPYLGGRWKGYLESSYDNRATKIPAVLEVKQTFNSIKTCLYTEQSFSSSQMATFVHGPTGQIELHYEYHNEPNEKATKTMHGHGGVAQLTFQKKEVKLVGSYYTTSQHERGNIGSLHFEFESDNNISCFKEV